ncbi:MAG: ABC transporter ATP-binding protein [Anaerolineae bacterium]|nr:ABC transporter ATP-binding protein [Anaerolineae bacterium]
MSDIKLQHITKSFKQVPALDDISFEIKDNEFFVLLGPTGAGKTTTLRIIAGLEKPDSGQVVMDGAVVNDLQPADRDIAFVFQQYSLYPTMSVYDNLAFPLRSPIRKTPEDIIKQRVTKAAELLRINHLLERKTARLSGGEMQRVSIGRAIVREPRVFLMDEPLSNLDAKLRESLRVELKHIQKTQHSTTLFVTHDQIEALTMADRIGVLRQGKLIQVGTPIDIYDRPATTFVAQLVGTPRINLQKASHADSTVRVENSALAFKSPSAALPAAFTLGIRPEDVKVSSTGAQTGKVVLIEPLGVESVVHIQTGDTQLTSIQPGITPLRLNDEVKFDVDLERLHCFDANGSRITI